MRPMHQIEFVGNQGFCDKGRYKAFENNVCQTLFNIKGSTAVKWGKLASTIYDTRKKLYGGNMGSN